MEIELKEIRDYLAGIPPFDRLDMDLVEKLTQKTSIRYLRRGSEMPPPNVTEQRLYIIRKGAIALYSQQDNLLGKLADGDICTVFCMEAPTDKFIIKVEEDTLVYTIACDDLSYILAGHTSVTDFISKTASQRLNAAVSTLVDAPTQSSSLIHTPINQLIASPVETIESGTSIFEAAQIMRDMTLSSLVVMKDGKPTGMLTDKDITKRCVAAGISPERPADDIMTNEIISVSSDTSSYDALMIMTRKHIHHLPVIDEESLSGIVTVTDLMRREGRNSAYLTSAIRKARTIEKLQELSATIPQLQVQLVKMGATAEHVGKGVTSITSAISRRLITLAEEKLGSPPVPYAWVAAGSQARREQTSHSDQDNGLIISDAVQEKDMPWFEELARFVNDGLNECGYVYCPGNVMASNPQWRQPASVWAGYFDEWINKPEPMALMYSSIFFDLRTIHGDKELLAKIREDMLKQTKKNSLFRAHLVGNALKLKPPLGFFRDFVLVHDGEHNDTLDLKHNGIAPIVDLARIYALAEGISAVNTTERLQQAAGTPSLSKEGAANLQDALIFIGTLRIKHQADQIQRGDEPDNYMSPKEISKLEREHLKDAFKVIQTMQQSLESHI